MPWKVDKRHSKIGSRHRAESRYYMMCSRVKNCDAQKNRNYANVKIRVSKEDFIAWFMERDFERCSVDRINKDGDYELSNMQVIPLSENIAKDKLTFKDGFGRCYSCKETKPVDDFTPDKRRMTTGRTTICKSCEAIRSKLRVRNSSKKKKDD